MKAETQGVDFFFSLNSHSVSWVESPDFSEEEYRVPHAQEQGVSVVSMETADLAHSCTEQPEEGPFPFLTGIPLSPLYSPPLAIPTHRIDAEKPADRSSHTCKNPQVSDTSKVS